MARSTKRWKVAFALAATIVLVAVVLLLYLWRNFAPDRYVQGRIVNYLESKYHVKVQIDSVWLDLKGNRLFLRGLKISDARFPASPPAIYVGELEIGFDYNLW